MMKKIYGTLLMFILCITSICSGKIVKAAEGDVAIDEMNFPDANFRNYVSEQFDKDTNDILSKEEQNSVKEIDVTGKEIINLKGIEFFIELEILNCSNNSLSEIDISNLGQLTDLDCSNNSLSTIDLSKNIKLKFLTCENAELTDLDLTNNNQLEFLNCSNNKLKTLDLSNIGELIEFYCHNNELIELDLSNNIKLCAGMCHGNQFKEIDISNNSLLQVLTTDIEKEDITFIISDKGFNINYIYNSVMSDKMSKSNVTNLKDCVIDDGNKLTFESGKNTASLQYNGHTQTFHYHKLTLHEKVDATCLKDGSKAYYECNCGKYYEDEARTKVIKDIEQWKVIPKNKHDVKCVEGKAATTSATGEKTYYHCNSCNKNYEDLECSKEIQGDINIWKIIPKIEETKVIIEKGSIVKLKGNIYKVISKKSKTVAFYNEKKNAKTVTIPKTIKIQGVTYKVSVISKNAFKNNKKLKKVTIGAEVKKIEGYAFTGCKNLKTILVKTTKLSKIEKNAFKGIHKKATIKVPKKKYKKYKKMMTKKIGYKKSMRIKK